MELALFNISNFRVDGGAMFGVIPKALWNRSVTADENNNIVLSLNSLVVNTGEKVILVDSGWGDKQDEKFFRYAYLHGGEGLVPGLAKRGYRPEDITDVIVTHLHADHCGGCFALDSSGTTVPVFPNARYHISRVQWEWANKSNIREEDAFLPENIKPFQESGRLNLVESDTGLCKGVSLRLYNGHTPGLMLPLIDFRGRKYFFAGDLIPTSAHIPLLWNMSYEINPLITISEKQSLLTEALSEDYIIIFQHDPLIECCMLRETPKGIRAGTGGKLTDYL